MTTRYLICGGRNFDDWTMLERALDKLILHPEHATIIHGAARGADRLAAQWGLKNGATVIGVPADWDAHGKAAGPIRNRRMLTVSPDVVIAFPGGPGTANMIEQARGQQIVTIQVVG